MNTLAFVFYDGSAESPVLRRYCLEGGWLPPEARAPISRPRTAGSLN